MNPPCPRCNRRTWGYAQWCPACGLEARDYQKEVKEIVKETWAEQEVPKEQGRLWA